MVIGDTSKGLIPMGIENFVQKGNSWYPELSVHVMTSKLLEIAEESFTSWNIFKLFIVFPLLLITLGVKVGNCTFGFYKNLKNGTQHY